MLKAKPLEVLSHIRHGFFTREGGVSRGIYASLNCGYGSDDNPDNVTENRARVAGKLSVERDKLLTVHQIHSANVIDVTSPWTPQTAPKADAMVSSTPGIALGVLAADCVPVLFADK
ncbi:laccase domain-containing protein, partial [Parvibaculum sp.]